MFKYSIIVCAYNEAEHIGKCLKSLILQNFDSDEYEILVIDNSSIDATAEKVKETIESYSDRNISIRLITIKHVGLSASRNTALELANSKYVSFVDGDACVDINWLKQIDKAVSSRQPNEKVFSGSVKNLNTSSVFSEFLYNAHVGPALNSSTESKLVGANMTFDKTVFTDVQFLDGLRRGDESCLLEQLKQIEPFTSEKHVPLAVVFNDYPASIAEWTKVLFSEGRMRFLIDHKIIKSKRATDKSKMLFRVFYLTAVLFLLINVVTMSLSVESFFICLLPIVARFWGARRMMRNSLRDNFGGRRIFTAILSPAFALYNFFIRDLAIVVSALVSRRTSFVPISSKSEVLDVFIKPYKTQ